MIEISKFKLLAKSLRYWAMCTAPTTITLIGRDSGARVNIPVTITKVNI